MCTKENFVDLKKLLLKQNNYYSFIYNGIFHHGKFIEKKNTLTIPPQTMFIFENFVIQNHVYQPLNIACFNESNNFSDSDSDNSSESHDDNIDIEYELINIEDNDYIIL